MITLVFTYRNRSIYIVEKCLQSLALQTITNFKMVLVNYGSDNGHSQQIEELIKDYDFVNYIYVDVSKQLWNKSRAINIALKDCQTDYFFVGDIDMMFRPDFVEQLNLLKSEVSAVYFQVGFLRKEESSLEKKFEDYKIKHLTNNEATGMTLYSTALLKNLNGYDEFYHGWGAEDTDVHVRMQNAGYDVNFFNKEVLILHQWHPKKYRTKESKEPFHQSLEQINHQYFQKISQEKKVMANTNKDWGMLPEKVLFPEDNIISIALTNQKSEIDALLCGIMENHKGKKMVLNIILHAEYKNIKNIIKKMLGKKYRAFYDLQTINDLILANIIAHYRNQYYEYEWNRSGNSIQLNIKL
jgi:hypothetical protein